MNRKMLGAIALAAIAVSIPLATRRGQTQQTKPRVIILGFDGVDARFTERWMNEGNLPNLAKLRDRGTFSALRPTIPAQTPVSWSTFSTGIDPGRTGIFDFLRRDPKTYLPSFAAYDETVEPFFYGSNNKWIAAGAAAALSFIFFFAVLTLLRRSRRISVGAAAVVGVIAGVAAGLAVAKYLPLTRPGVINRRQGTPFWEVVAAAGHKAQVIHVPITFPANDFPEGQMLSGLGVPDISARVGKPFYFTSELDFSRQGGGEFSIEVVQLEDNRGVIQTQVVGPPNKLFAEPKYIATPMTVTVAEDRQSVAIKVGEQEISLRPGEWSGWVEFSFPFNPLIKVSGISRFYLLASNPEVKLYLSPINFDPRQLPPGFRISTPVDWAPQLAEQFGLYKTIGWAIDTWAISEGFATEQIFWDDMLWTVAQYRNMYRSFLASDQQLFVQCFEFPDRVAHIFYRVIDPEHPSYDATLAAKWSGALLESYQIMDEIVGEAMTAAEREGAILMVLSDHGFTTWRKSINYNTWLAQNGYLGLRAGVQASERSVEILFDSGQFWENVDWSKTRAYSLGLSNVYVNLKGREAHGTVNPGAEYDQLKRELKEGLEAVIDPENGAHPISRVFLREDVYKQFDPNLVADLIVTTSDGYRIAWQSSLGGVQKDLIQKNTGVWSGDHCSMNPEIVKGIFFTNQKISATREPYIADIYPTVLSIFGAKAPYELDGQRLW